jgi:hypothetical protein
MFVKFGARPPSSGSIGKPRKLHGESVPADDCALPSSGVGSGLFPPVRHPGIGFRKSELRGWRNAGSFICRVGVQIDVERTCRRGVIEYAERHLSRCHSSRRFDGRRKRRNPEKDRVGQKRCAQQKQNSHGALPCGNSGMPKRVAHFESSSL